MYIAPFCGEELLLIGSAARAAELVPRLHEGPADEVLAGESLVAYSEEMPIVRSYWSLVFNVHPRSRHAIVVPDLRGVLAAVAAGIGISVVPGYLCQSAIDCGEVHQILTPEQSPTATLVLVVRARALSQRHLAAVHSHLVEHGRLFGGPEPAEYGRLATRSGGAPPPCPFDRAETSVELQDSSVPDTAESWRMVESRRPETSAARRATRVAR